jgi:hypothetical protein
MRKGVGFATALATGFAVGTASAEGLSGPIEDIDQASSTVVVAGEVFIVSSETIGPKLSELKKGDNVEVVYSPLKGTVDGIDAMLIRRTSPQ